MTLPWRIYGSLTEKPSAKLPSKLPNQSAGKSDLLDSGRLSLSDVSLEQMISPKGRMTGEQREDHGGRYLPCRYASQNLTGSAKETLSNRHTRDHYEPLRGPHVRLLHASSGSAAIDRRVQAAAGLVTLIPIARVCSELNLEITLHRCVR
jgi:hypothetical protein